MIGLRNRGNLPSAVQDEFENFASRLREFFLKEHTEDGEHIAAQGAAYVPTGAVFAWTTATAPDGYVFCRGQAIDRVQYKPLFDVIGTTFGVGDGSTTFNVPDLQQRFPLGKAAAGTGSALAGTGGNIDHTHGASGLSTAASTTGTGVTGTGSTGTGNTGTGNTGTGTSGGESAHTHSFSATTGSASGGGLTVDVSVPSQSVTTDPHTHSVSGTTGAGSEHTHSVPSLSVPALSVPALSIPALSIPALTIPSLSVNAGTTAAGNPPYLVLNYVIKT